MSRSTIFSTRPGALLAVLILLAAGAVAHWLDAPPPPVSGQGRVSDGDSFRLGAERVRLLGLDAPELDQDCQGPQAGNWPCGRAARDRLAALLALGPLDCRPQGHDRYDRLLARCAVGGADLGAIMVRDGLALSAGDYWQEQAAARAAQRGIWAGSFEAPSDWRQDHPRPQGLLHWLGL